jgi:hypothetical protein
LHGTTRIASDSLLWGWGLSMAIGQVALWQRRGADESWMDQGVCTYVRGTGSSMCPDRCVVGAVVRPTRTPATVSHLPAEPTGMCMRKAPRRQGGNGRSCMGPIPGRRSMPSEASTVVERSVDSERCFTAMVTRAMQRRLVAMVPVVLGDL